MKTDTAIISPRDLTLLVEREYKKGSEKVTAKFLHETLRGALRYAATLPTPIRIRLEHELNHTFGEFKPGMRAGDVHSRLFRLRRNIDSDEPVANQESTVGRLERQLQDLRQLVSAPTDIDRRFRELQQQVESMKDNNDIALLSEKQDDMLQRFIKSDKKAFIIMPFARDFDNVWFGAIKPACVELKYAPLRVDEVNLSSLITDDIERYSTMADVVVVDLTGNNPNVMFEFGWALAKSKKPIVICQGDHSSKVSFDVRGIRHVSYENSWLGVETLKKKIKDYISATETQGTKPKAPRKPKAELVPKTS